MTWRARRCFREAPPPFVAPKTDRVGFRRADHRHRRQAREQQEFLHVQLQGLLIYAVLSELRPNSRARGSGRRLFRYAYTSAHAYASRPHGREFDFARTLPPSVARRIGIVAAGRRRRVVGIRVRMIVCARGRRAERRSADRRARGHAGGMSVPGAMPCSAMVADAADESPTAIAARREPIDEKAKRVPSPSTALLRAQTPSNVSLSPSSFAAPSAPQRRPRPKRHPRQAPISWRSEDPWRSCRCPHPIP